MALAAIVETSTYSGIATLNFPWPCLPLNYISPALPAALIRRHNRSSKSQLQSPWNQLLQIILYYHSTKEYQLEKSNAKCSTCWKSRSLSSTGDSGFKLRNTQNTKIIKRMLRICPTLQTPLEERHQNQLAMLTRTSSTSTVTVNKELWPIIMDSFYRSDMARQNSNDKSERSVFAYQKVGKNCLIQPLITIWTADPHNWENLGLI
jgi:hypothetical protein